MKVSPMIVIAGFAVVALGIVIALRELPAPAPEPLPAESSVTRPSSTEATRSPEKTKSRQPAPSAAADHTTIVPEKLAITTNKLERLSQIRDDFRSLAAGDRLIAIRAARQFTNEVEREIALLTLVTEWTHGELSSPLQRARNIAMYGLEAGLGMELVDDRELALLWANELTEGQARTGMLQQIAMGLVRTDPAAAFALNEQLPEAERRNFDSSVFAGWASKDTEAALAWANQYSDPARRDAAIQSIRAAAPVGIGAELRTGGDGYPTINGLIPGSPAQLNGQLRPGDRIVGIAQGDNTFVDAHDLALNKAVEMIRGAPGTLLQLQVLPADAPPNAQPRIINILRDQIKFKR